MAKNKPTPQSIEFWNSYEEKVEPHHFAKIKSVYSGKPEALKSHRNGGEGYSETHVHIPDEDLKAHAQSSQNALLSHLQKEKPESLVYRKVKQADGSIKKEPHVVVYRGVGGDYAHRILEAFGHDVSTHEIDPHRVAVKTLPFQSWSLSSKVAQDFSRRRMASQADAGAVIRKELPLKDVLHEGFISGHIPDEHRAHPEESEIVFRHPAEKMSISDLAFVRKNSDYAAEPKVREAPMRSAIKKLMSGKDMDENGLMAFALSDNPEYVKAASQHPKFNESHVKAIKDKLDRVVSGYDRKATFSNTEKELFHALSNPFLEQSHIEHLSDQLGPFHWGKLAETHPDKVTSDLIHKHIDKAVAAKDEDGHSDTLFQLDNVAPFAHFPAFSKEHEDKLLNRLDETEGNHAVKKALKKIVSSPYASSEAVGKALKEDIGGAGIINHPKINADHLRDIIERNGHIYPEAWEHPKINESHALKTIASHPDKAVVRDAIFAAHTKGFGKAIEAAQKHPDMKVRQMNQEIESKVNPMKKAEEDHLDMKLNLKSKHVTPEQLRNALSDENPHVRAIAAKHPLLSPELKKEILAGDDEWLKTHVDTKEFEDDGPIRFPNLSDSKHQPLELDGDAYRQQAPEDAHGKKGYTFATAMDNDPSNPEAKICSAINMEHFDSIKDPHDRSAALRATKDHEAQHLVFRDLDQRYGRNNGTPKVIEHLFNALNPDEKKNLAKMFAGLDGTKRYPKTMYAEESLAHLHNYLNDHKQRDLAHQRLGVKPEEFHQALKDIHAKLKVAAQEIRPEHLGLSKSDDLTVWAQNLQKDEHQENLALQIGVNLHLQEYINAIYLASGKKILVQDIEKFLPTTGGDDFVAALMAAGMDNPQDRDAVERAMDFVDLYKSESTLDIKVIEPTTPSGQKVAETLNRAKAANGIEAVNLSGKHSSGALLATDPETDQMFLLKPDQKRKSPAMGITDQELPDSTREAAFYAASGVFGLASDLPHSFAMKVDGKPFVAIEFLPEDFAGAAKVYKKDYHRLIASLGTYLKKGTLHKWAVMDYVLGQCDRHGNNMMVSKDGRVKLIDQGSALAGKNFDPGGDKHSFVPFYLRVWSSNKEFNSLAPEERMEAMPELDALTDFDLREWALNLSPQKLGQVLSSFGIDPAPALQRLVKVKDGASKVNLARYINYLWAYPKL